MEQQALRFARMEREALGARVAAGRRAAAGRRSARRPLDGGLLRLQVKQTKMYRYKNGNKQTNNAIKTSKQGSKTKE